MTQNVTETLQSFIRQFINKIIREDFKDLEETPFEALDVNVPRHAIRIICTHVDSDSLLHTITRLIIYGFFVFLPAYLSEGYNIPYVWLHENYDFIPQIIFYFVDDPSTRTVRNKNKPLEMETSIRLPFLDISQQSSTNDIERIANKIFLNFKNFKVTKGKIKYSYRDKVNKINMSSFFASKSEAVELFKNVILCLENVVYDNDNIVEHKPEKSFTVSEKRYVFGRKLEIERRRSGVVQFKKATLHIQGIKPIKLVDTIKNHVTGSKINDLIQTFYE